MKTEVNGTVEDEMHTRMTSPPAARDRLLKIEDLTFWFAP